MTSIKLYERRVASIVEACAHDYAVLCVFPARP